MAELASWDEVFDAVEKSKSVKQSSNPTPKAKAEPESWDDVDAAIKEVESGFSQEYLKELKAAEAVAQIGIESAPLGVQEWGAAAALPPEYRRAALERSAELFKERGPMKGAGNIKRTAVAIAQGGVDWGMPAASFFAPKELQLDGDQEAFRQALISVREGSDPSLSEGSIASTIQQAARMAVPMVGMGVAGRASGTMAKSVGLGAVGTRIAQGVGVTAAAYPMAVDQSYRTMIAEGLDPEVAAPISRISGLFEGAIESAMPDPFKVQAGVLKGSIRRIVAEGVRRAGVQAGRIGIEASEEGAQAFTREAMYEVARAIDEDIPNQGLGQAFVAAAEEGLQSIGPLTVVMGPSITLGALGTARNTASRPEQYRQAIERRDFERFRRELTNAPDAPSQVPTDTESAERLSQLQEIRSKGFVSINDASNLNIEGKNRKERLANVDKEIEALQNPSPWNDEFLAAENARLAAEQGQPPSTPTADPATLEQSPLPSTPPTGTATQPGATLPGGEISQPELTPEEAAKLMQERIAQRRAGQSPASTIVDKTAPVPQQPKGGDPTVTDAEQVPPSTSPKPVRVYHGTDAESFTQFDDAKIGSSTDSGLLGAGHYFSTDADGMKRNKKTLVTADISLSNPLKLSMPDFKTDKNALANKAIGTTGLVGKELSDAIKAKGFDGVELDYSPTGYAHKEYAVYDSAGVKVAKPEPAVDAQSKGTAATSKTPAPAATEQSAVRPGKVGDMLAAGEVVTTSSGRQTTPFPKIDTDSDRKSQNTVKRVDKWLHENAVEEARSRGDDFNLTQFSAEDPAKLPPASKDAMEEYLFGEQPKVPKPITKPLVAPKSESKWQAETRAKLDAVPALKGSKFDMDEKAGKVKVTRPDGLKATIHFNADEELAKAAVAKGRKPETIHGRAVRRSETEFDIYVRSDANHTNILNHEVMHWLEFNGVVTKEEVEKHGGREAIAEKYGKWAELKQRKKDSVFQRIYDALEAVFSSQRKFFEEVGERKKTKPQENLSKNKKPSVETAKGGKSETSTIVDKPNEEELAKLKTAGIKVEKTKKGWIVTGLPSDLSQEMQDGIEFEGGRKTGGGYFFKENPTSRLVPTAEAITDENRKSDEAAKAGLVSTPIGILSQEDADWYRGERQQRLELAKQMLNDANNAVGELLSQFVPSAKRGLFKISLMKAAETGDPSTILRFDEMVDYSINHPELGLPQDESGLFDRLLQSVIQEKDLAKQIDDELATELASDKGDDSFEFGAQQTAIEGFEEDVARQDRKDVSEAKQAKSKKQFESDNSKGTQKTFLTDIYGDPTQGTLFDPDGVADAEDADLEAMIDAEFDAQLDTEKKPAKKSTGKKKSPSAKPKTRIRKAADNARQEADDLWAELNKQSKDKLTTGLDPDLAKLAVRVALAEIKAGTLSFAAFVEKTVAKVPAEMLDKLKPYMEMAWKVAHKRGMTDDPAGKFDDVLAKKSTDYGTVESPNRVELGKYFQKQLESGKDYKSIVEARKEAATLIAGEGATIEPGTPAAKAIDEAVEQGVVRTARKIAKTNSDPLQVYDKLLDLYERQPRLAVRTGTSMIEQAYSTPAPAAWIASILSDTSRSDIAYDSSAGNGMLLLGVDSSNAIANELNPDRANALRAMGYDVHEGDATEYTPKRQPDRIIINPPFGEDVAGKTWTVGGIKTDKVDHAIVLKTLESLPEDGKAVLIIGSKGFEKRQPKDELRRGEAYKTDKNFYNALYDNYNVTDHFTMHGDMYAKQGAEFPIDVIVIDGRGKSKLPKPYEINRQNAIPRVITNWKELRDVAERYLDTGTGRPSDLSTEPIADDMAGLSSLLEGQGERTGGKGSRPGKNTRGRGSVSSGRTDNTQQPRGNSEPSSIPIAPDESRSDRTERLPGDSQPSATARPDGGNDAKKLDRETDVGSEDGLQLPYSQRSSAKNVGTLVPATHARAVQEALEKAESRYGNLDEFVARELGYKTKELLNYFSAEQIDALALNIARHKEGKAFVLGDQTGVGKGRVAAATMVYAKRQGLVPVFMTQSPDLFSDMYRDLQDIGQHSEGEPFYALATNTLEGKDKIELPDGTTITQTADFAKDTINAVARSVANDLGPIAMIAVQKTTDADGKPLGKTPTGRQRVRSVQEQREYDAVFSTYSQMQTVGGETKDRHTAMSLIASKAFFVLDESHNAGGVKASGRGSENADAVGRAARLRELISDSQGVLFLSATYAKNPDVMDLYAKTGMADAVEGGSDSLIETIGKGGIPLQQVLSEMLVESGAYMRREKSFDGIEFSAVVKETGREEAGEVAGIFDSINTLDKIKNDIIKTEVFKRWLTANGFGLGKDSATGKRGLDSSVFSSIVHNLVDQMLLSVKADAVADEAIASLERGESPVIALSNTAGAALDNYLSEFPANVGDEIEFGFNSTAYRYLERSREIMLTDVDASGKKTSRRIRLPDDVLGPYGVQAYNEAKSLIDNFAADIPASPIDHIRNRLEKAGYKVAEITGRDLMVDYSSNKMRLAKRPSSEQGKSGKLASVRGYNSGEIDALILNQSGSTGLSAHASSKFINQKRRHMIVAQADKNIDTFMQMLGRINRTGQIEQHEGQPKGSNLPKYTLLMTDVPAEIRPASVLIKKLSSLNANVTADAKGSVSFDAPDILNKVGDRVVAEYVADNPALNHALDDIVEVNAEGSPKVMPDIARKVSGRMAMRPIPEQQAFWDAVTETYAEEIEQLNKLGKNPLAATKLDLGAKTLERIEIFAGDPNADSPFLQPAYADRALVKKQGEPMTPDEIKGAINQFYGLRPKRKRGDDPFGDMAAEMHREAMTGKDVPQNVTVSTPNLRQAISEWVAKKTEIASAAINSKAEQQTARLANGEAIDRVRSRASTTETTIRRRLNSLAPGMAVTVSEALEDGKYSDPITGIVVNVKSKKGNEHLPSGWVATIAISSPDRVVRVPFSRIEATPQPGDMYVAPMFEVAGDLTYVEWEEVGDVYEERVIGTGNVLAAFDKLVSAGDRGNIVFFTNEEGVSQRGVLMPRSFDLNRWADKRPATFKTAQQVLDFINTQQGQLNHQANDPNFAIQFVMDGSTMLVRSPRSRQKSGKYTTNRDLIAASGTDFVSVGQILQMKVRGEKQQLAVIDAALKLGPLVAANFKEDAKNIISQSEQAVPKSKLADSLRKQSGDTDVLYQKVNVDPQVVVQATDLAIDAQDAGIESFDELVAFSVKAVGEQRTRELGQYLAAAGDMLGLKGVRPVGDVIGMPGVTREQAMVLAKAAFPMLTDEQIEAGLDIQDATAFGRDQVGFAPFGTPAPGMSASQRDKGDVKGWTQFISAARAIIGATGKADVSTFIHELFHPMRKFLLDRNIPAESRSGITDDDIKALEDYAGAKDGKWTVESEEKAAKAWEQYWYEGKSPTTALRSLFEKLARWMREVYRGVHQITGGQLPPEVRQLFDKIVQRGGISEQEMPQDDNLTSIKNEVMNDLRAQRGLPELADVAAQTQQEWIDTAESRMRAEPGIADRLVKAINANPRNLSNIEVAILQLHYRNVNNELASVSDRLFEAKDAGDALEAAKVQREVDLVMNALAEIEDASKAAGREWGRAGVSRQIVLRKDFSLAGIMRKARIANAGNALSAEQQAEMIELAKRVAELEGKLAKSEQEKLDLERQRNVERTLEEERKRPPVVRTTARKKASEAVSAFKQKFANIFSTKSSDTLLQTEDELMAEAAQEVVEAYVKAGVFSFGEFIANVQRDLGELPTRVGVAFATAWEDAKMMGEIPTPEFDVNNLAGMTRLARRIQRSLVEAGITDREAVVDAVHKSLQELDPEITRRETMDALSGYGQYSKLSQADNDKIIRDINGQLQQLAKLEDMRSGQAPSKTGGERRTPSDEERRLIKEVNEAKRRGGFVVTDPQAQLKTAMDAAKTSVRNRISDLEYEIQTRQRIVRTKTELTPDPELASLRKRRDALLDVHKTLFPKPGATMEQRIAAANRAIDASIADLEQRLKTGDVTPIGRKVPVSTPELDAKRARLKALQEQRDAIRALANPKMTPEERADKAYKASLLKRLADYQERMVNSEFDAQPKKELRILTPEQLQLKKQLEDVKDQFFQKAAEYRLAHMSPVEKAWDYVKETSHLSRAIMTSFDLSAVFRQGGVGSLAHPVLAAETSREMWNAMKSSQAEFDIAEGIRNDPMYQFAMTAKLAITEEDGKITRQEEAFMGRWARHGIGKTGSKVNVISQKALTPIAMSARAYTTFLNGMRFKLFKLMVNNLGANGQVTADEAKVIAQYVNVATGRADLGKYNQAMANLNVLFFAPRYVASRFQFFALPFYLLPKKSVSLRVKKQIAMEYARYATGLGAFLATAVALGSLLFDDDDDDKPTVELWDTTSSDWMKVKIGETRIDPMSGFSQVVTVMSQVITGRKKGADGEIQHLRGEGRKWGSPTTWNVMSDFARKKFAPIPSAVFNVIVGENVVGEEVTPLTATRDLFIPLSVSEVKETMQARGVPAGSAITILTLLGMGGGTYGPKTKFANGTEEERKTQLENDLKKMEWDSPDLPYRDLLNEEQYDQMNDRREERKQDLAYAATALPVHNKGQSKESFEKEVAAQQEAMEAVMKAGWSEEFVRQLLRDYAKTRGNKEAVVDRIRRIKRIFSKTGQ